MCLPIDINECSASPSVCDVNANCQNNEGSYLCSCKASFTGDGKTCLGKQNNTNLVPRGPFLESPRQLYGPGKLFDERKIYLKDLNFVGF